MTDDSFSWSNLGGGSSHLVKISERIQFLSKQQTDILNAIIDIHKVIGELRSEVSVMNSNFLTDYRRMASGNYDDKSVTSFLSLDDLNIEAPSRPVEDSIDEDDSLVIAEEMIIVNDGFTAPVPERNKNKESYEGMTDEDIVIKIIDDLKTYLSEHTAPLPK